MTRNHMNDQGREASRVLDMWQAGADEDDGVSLALVNWSLRILGDTVALKEFDDDGNQIYYLEKH